MTRPIHLGLFILYFSIQGLCQQDEIFLSLSTTSNQQLPNIINRQEGTSLRIKCSYPTLTDSITWKISLKSINGSETTDQVSCGGKPGSLDWKLNAIKQAVDSEADIQGVQCTVNTLEFSISKLTSRLPVRFRCSREDILDGDTLITSDEVQIRTHTIPTNPIIPTMSTPREGEMINYTCSSTARPPPLLKFTLSPSNTEPTSGTLVHSPDSSSINEDSPSGTSVLTWSVNASRALNTRRLKCQVLGHVSQTVRDSTSDLAVIYGPYGQADESVYFNIGYETTKVLTCSLDSNPTPSYTWYRDLLSEANRVAIGDSLMLNKSGYPQVKEDSAPLEVKFICEGRNPDNQNKAAQRVFTVHVFSNRSVAVAPPGGTKQDASLLDWQIALIAVGGAAVLIIVIVIIVLLALRSKTRTPGKAKKQAAKKEKLGTANSKYQGTSNNSLYGGQQAEPASGNNASNQQGTPDGDYRYNLEDYASTLDSRPRSRKPVALDDNMSLKPFEPSRESGPPPYQPYNSPRDSYHPHDSYNGGYGAPC